MATFSPAALQRAVPALFVLIWSTGFVVARYGMPHAGPMDFLALRFMCSALLFVGWVWWAGAAWPRGRAQWLHLAVTGLLMHAGYLGGVWMAVKAGLGAGMASLIVGLQPVLTALWLSAVAGGAARVRAVQWLGLALGLTGLVLVVWHKLHLGQAQPANVAMALLALASITAGTLYQKRAGGDAGQRRRRHGHVGSASPRCDFLHTTSTRPVRPKVRPSHCTTAPRRRPRR